MSSVSPEGVDLVPTARDWPAWVGFMITTHFDLVLGPFHSLIFIGLHSVSTSANTYHLNTRAGELPRSASSHFLCCDDLLLKRAAQFPKVMFPTQCNQYSKVMFPTQCNCTKLSIPANSPHTSDIWCPPYVNCKLCKIMLRNTVQKYY